MFKSKNGQSLVTVLIASAIGMIVMAGLVTMITNVLSSQRAVQSKDANREVVGAIRDLLADHTICKASFDGGNPDGNGFAKTEIKDSSGVVKYKTGTVLLNGLLKISNFTVKNYSDDNTADTRKQGHASLVIDMEKVGTEVGGAKMRAEIILRIHLDSSELVDQCHAVGGNFQIWQVNLDNPGNIYYDGKVGIGTDSPWTTLHVRGEPNPSEFAGVVAEATTPEGSAGFCSIGDSLTGVGPFVNKTIFGCTGVIKSGQSLGADPTLDVNLLGDFALSANKNLRFVTGFAPEWSTADPGSSAGPVPSSKTRVSILSDGNVGIGTTSPKMALEIASKFNSGMDQTLGLYASSPEYSAGINFASSKADLDVPGIARDVATLGLAAVAGQFGSEVQSGDIALGSKIGRDIHLATRTNALANSPTRLIVKNGTGYIGIGTTIPRQKVEIKNGNLIVGLGHLIAGDTLGGGDGNLVFDYSGAITFRNHSICLSPWNGTPDDSSCYEGTMILNGGNLGIGQNSPTHKLDVAGEIHSSLDILSDQNIKATNDITGTNIIATNSITGTNINATNNITASGSISANSFLYTSDMSLKEEVVSIENSLDKILKLRPVKFRWKKDHKEDYGFIAQEVKNVIPEIMSVDSQNIMHVDYAKIIPFLVDQIQKQQKEIDMLKKKVK